MVSFADILAECKLWQEAAQQFLIERIEAIPQNEAITPIGNGCFTVKFSEIGKSKILVAEYYDFDQQKKTLIEVVNKSRGVETLVSVLRRIIEDGKYQGTMFHPDVLSALEEIVKVSAI